jgi:hypothetical protein
MSLAGRVSIVMEGAGERAEIGWLVEELGIPGKFWFDVTREGVRACMPTGENRTDGKRSEWL